MGHIRELVESMMGEAAENAQHYPIKRVTGYVCIACKDTWPCMPAVATRYRYTYKIAQSTVSDIADAVAGLSEDADSTTLLLLLSLLHTELKKSVDISINELSDEIQEEVKAQKELIGEP